MDDTIDTLDSPDSLAPTQEPKEPKERPTMVPAFDVESFAREEDAKALERPAPRRPTNEDAAALRARLRPLNRVPRLTKSLSELRDLVEDPQTAFVLGFIDGVLRLDVIIRATKLPELDALRVLDRLVTSGVVVLEA